MSLSRGDTGLEAGLRRESDLRLWGVEVWELRPEAKPPPPTTLQPVAFPWPLPCSVHSSSCASHHGLWGWGGAE